MPPPRSLRALALLLPLLAGLAPATAQTPHCDARGPADGHAGPAGAYRQADGAVLSILPAGAPGHWRITHFGTGKSHRLHPVGAQDFQSAADLDSAEPVAFRYRVTPAPDGQAQTLTIQPKGQPATSARRIALREQTAKFHSGDTQLFGLLTLPEQGQGPFKTVVFVHGSDPVPSVGQEWLPHLLAANGIASLVFDKRGTGCSSGQYLQHFERLSDDVLAAVRWLETRPEIDRRRIGLAGFSQGGWVAPLAALRDPTIAFVAVGYGLAMSMADEHRLEAPLKLKDAGADERAVAEFETLNAALHQVARDGFKDWRAFEELVDRFGQRPWFAMARQQSSWVGFVLQMGLPQARQVAPQMFQSYFQPFYDPVPTLERLSIPMLWLIAEQDVEAPPGPTIEVLSRLRRQGKPLALEIFPGTDHGLQAFVLRDGQRIRTQYAEGYFSTLLNWIQAQR